jgi:hypothetical protein
MYPTPPTDDGAWTDLLGPKGRATQLVTERRVELPTVRGKKSRRFIAPIPLPWVQAACKLPGKALAVALAIWHLARMRKSDTVELSQTRLSEFGVKRWAKYRALAALEKAGLVRVVRRQRRNPEVTVLYPQAEGA